MSCLKLDCLGTVARLSLALILVGLLRENVGEDFLDFLLAKCSNVIAAIVPSFFEFQY
jgi:hypothetical protein